MIQVVITTWQVPFDQMVHEVRTFYGADHGPDADAEALAFINVEAKKWWDANDGDRYVAESQVEVNRRERFAIKYPAEPFEPIKELGYNHARWELWGGETGFHAMLDQESYWRLHEAHYKREFDDKGLKRPGYLINAYVAQGKDEYKEAQAQGMAEIEAHYGDHSKH